MTSPDSILKERIIGINLQVKQEWNDLSILEEGLYSVTYSFQIVSDFCPITLPRIILDCADLILGDLALEYEILCFRLHDGNRRYLIELARIDQRIQSDLGQVEELDGIPLWNLFLDGDTDESDELSLDELFIQVEVRKK